ncbi:fused DSP-PTPase phosphatase/NAD kinase-like protein [Henriciella aquimarina]|uniref:fused DSP-PTPase phosphatase/NAD kinase-like protein n=1 Tax=Henriciella aquimarina TaxID=545261 RepID=UPI000A05CBD5|nr:sulfur transferase domain-containing protein [Henriciella aquimarina]
MSDTPDTPKKKKKRKKKRAPHVAADLSTYSGRQRAERELVLGDHGFLRESFQNLHRISPEMWRSNQPNPRQVAEHAAERGVQTIINLRGQSTKGYYLLEKEACEAVGITLVDFQVFSRDTPTVETIFAARDLFEEIAYPALMHCKSGADRAGLMSVLYMIFRRGLPVTRAIEQLSGRYLHVKSGKTGMLDAFFQAYLDDTAGTGKSFLDWVQEDYDRMAVKNAFLTRNRKRFQWDRLLRRE